MNREQDEKMSPSITAMHVSAAERDSTPESSAVEHGEPGDESGRHGQVHPSLALPRFPSPLRHPLRAAGWLLRTLFGIVTLILLLAVVAAVPVLNFAVLGYLLEVEGRVARSGRLRDAFPALGLAPQLGSIVLGVWLWIFPLRLLSSAAADARLIDPAGTSAAVLRTATIVAGCLVAVHLCLAVARGGRFGCFLRPVKNVRWLLQQVRDGYDWDQAAESVRAFVRGLELKRRIWLGMRGFAGAFVWLVLPTALFASAERTEGVAFLVSIVGGLGLMLVFSWLPFLQARFAAENRWRALFELGAVREMLRRAPLVSWLALLVLYALSLPLYLTKVVLPPRDAMWLVTLVFIVSMYPTRVVVGWAYHRAANRSAESWFGWRWLGRILTLATLGAYVFLLFFTQFIGEHGKGVLFEHHAFLLPVPF